MISVDEAMRNYAESWREAFTGPGFIQGPTPDPGRLRSLAQKYPEILVDTWEKLGFSGRADGRSWLCDPDDWSDVASTWQGAAPNRATDYFAVVRDSFGCFLLFSPSTGCSLLVSPLTGDVFPGSFPVAPTTPREVNSFVTSVGVSWAMDPLEFKDEKTGADLFVGCLSKNGALTSDSMYTFLPVPALGGEMTVESSTIEEVIVHETLLIDLDPDVVIHSDTARHLVEQEDARKGWIEGDEG